MNVSSPAVRTFFLALLFASAPARAANAITIHGLAADLADQSEGLIQPDPAEFARCADTRGESCENWTYRTFKKLPYLDTANGNISVDQVQRLFRTDWNPARFGGRTFVEHQEETYATYDYRKKDRRYVLPFANLRGWTGLNHPPLRELTGPVSDFHPVFGRPLVSENHPFYDEKFQRRIDSISGTELTAENHVDILKNHDSYLQKLDLIRRAKRRLWVTSMVFQCDESSSALLEALSERARAGVDVRMIIEGLYANTVYKGCLNTIRAMGINVLPVMESVTVKNLTHITHNKFWIRDGEEAIIGGQNILDDENLSTGFNEGYRDTDAWIHSGPTVTDLDTKFGEIWEKHRHENDLDFKAALREIHATRAAEYDRGIRGPAVFARLADPTLRSKGLCRVLSQEPGGTSQSIETTLTEMIEQTSEVAVVTTPRMKYNPAKSPESKPAGVIYAALVDAAERRGVRVELITNGADGMGGATTSKFRNLALAARSNGHSALEKFWLGFANDLGQLTSKGSFAAAETFVRQSPNIHGWNYFRYAHQKIHYLDRRMVGIGSFNLDGHSARGNRETEIFCMDDSLLDQAEKMLTLDLANSTPIRK